MKEFELTLSGTVYKCTSNHSDRDNQNWNIRSKVNDVTFNMEIPIGSKVSRSKCMLFVEVFHEALMTARDNQKTDLVFTNQLA